MNFISNVVDAIPVVGHVKGVVHYAVGDTDGGNKAMYQSTRTTAVLAGGAAGCLAQGPVGAVAGGIAVGIVADAVACAVMKERQGIVKACKDGAIISAGMQMALDGFGGYGMSDISTAVSQISEKVSTMTTENFILLTYIVLTAWKRTHDENSGSSQPPERKRKTNRKPEPYSEAEFEKFMELLTRILRIIYDRGTEPFSSIFAELTEKKKAYLVKIIMPLNNDGTLESIVELVIKIFEKHFNSEISFENFLSLFEFVVAYIYDELENRIASSTGTVSMQPKMECKERQRIYREIINQVTIVDLIVAKFKEVQTEIEVETSGPNNIFPDFRNIFAAVYHYWKHRRVPNYGTLSVTEYYDWIRQTLKEIKKTPEYNKHSNSRSSVTIVYEIFSARLGGCFRIVVKIYNGTPVLSTALVVQSIDQYHEDGDDFIELIIS